MQTTDTTPGAAASESSITQLPRPLRLAIFTTHPIQYQAPLFRELARARAVVPIVYFASRHGIDATLDKGFGTTFSWDIPLVEGYEFHFLENVSTRPDVDSFRGIRLRDARGVLRAGNFDAVFVLGWQSAGHLQMIRAALAEKIPLILRGESNLLRKAPRGLKAVLRTLLWLPARRLIYRWVFSRVAAFIAIGTRNAEFYRSFGVDRRKIHTALYGVENERFALDERVRAESRDRLRRENRIGPGDIVFVSAAKLISRKRPLDLLAAFAVVHHADPNTHLVYLGDGAQRTALEAEIAKLGLRGAVTITGFVNQRLVPEWYAAADCLVLPSDTLETWGLVANEAMAAGLPVILSDAVGSAIDLVSEGANGFVFPLGDVPALEGLMHKFASLSPDCRSAMGEISRRIVADASNARAATVIAGVVRSVAGANRVPDSC